MATKCHRSDRNFQKEFDKKWKEENKCKLQTFISLKQVFYVVVCLSMFDNNILMIYIDTGRFFSCR